MRQRTCLSNCPNGVRKSLWILFLLFIEKSAVVHGFISGHCVTKVLAGYATTDRPTSLSNLCRPLASTSQVGMDAKAQRVRNVKRSISYTSTGSSTNRHYQSWILFNRNGAPEEPEGENNECTMSRGVSHRRSVLQRVLLASAVTTGTMIMGSPSPGFAEEEASQPTASTLVTPTAEKVTGRKPYAPLEALLPATRVKRLIDRAVSLANEAVMLTSGKGFDAGGGQLDTSKQRQDEGGIISQLNHLLSEPQHFFLSQQEQQQHLRGKGREWELEPSTQYLDDYKTQRSKLPFNQQLLARIEQFGEERQWKRLKRREWDLESTNEMRAAFNYYTSNLRFGEGYQLTASPEEKKRLIRTYEGLPDVKAVITADLDLRDLYRNEILTAMEDARAEWTYQVSKLEKQGGERMMLDATELLALLRTAQNACDKWFAFISKEDVRDAMDFVLAEENEQRK